MVTFSNEHHEEMTSKRTRIGVPMLESVPELTGQSVIQTLDRVYATGVPEQIGEVEVQLMRDSTLTDCWFQISWQPTRDSKGAVTGVFVTAIAVTQHVQSRQALHAARVEEEREKLVAELTRALAMQDEFLMIASHELRTPLTSLRLQLDAAMAAVDKLEGTEQPRLAKSWPSRTSRCIGSSTSSAPCSTRQTRRIGSR